jgi:tRNA(fMet)-specific endonuclease VapC
LRTAGRRIPDNDVWIAALAIQHQMVLVTDDAHFDSIKMLECENWI